MQSLNHDEQGLVHHLVLGIAVVGVVVAGAFVAVLHANQHAAQSVNLAASQATKANSGSAIQATPNIAATAKPADTASSTAATATSPAAAPKPATTKTPVKPSGTTATAASSSSNSTSSAPAATPQSTLTGIIAGLQSGSGSAQVTNSTVTVAGPINNAQARPIVFKLNNQTYYAYTQGSAPNFNTTAQQTAESMAIITVSGNGAAAGPAHLNKANQLVDANSIGTNVGYSTGGNSSGK